jgi:membrane protein YdbS with pleckstrin-like domain
MAFPRRLLGPDEELILDLRPHWLALVKPGLTTVVIFVAMGLALAYVPSWSFRGWVKLGIVLVALGLFAGIPLRRFLAWITSEFVVTSDRVVHRSGVLSKRSMEIPLENVTDVRFEQGIVERLVGAGSLILESPGQYGQERFSHVANPEHVQKTIYELTEENRRRMAPVTPLAPVSAPARGGGPSVADELAKLARLRQQGVLTEEEFQAQKARLLQSG